jgi:glycogen operon protein
MPVWAFLDELRLTCLGLRNYWGYNPFAFMAPEPRYAVTEPEAEFRTMVEALHGAGIEVVLDVVLNHTAETDHLGPTLSLRGLDNVVYYRLDPDDPARYRDWAGCGNSLNLGHPRVLQLAMDALRHWADLGVDGFRFDLAPALGRDLGGTFRPDAALLQAIAQDPVLGGLKLIAEPWDLGPHGYRQGEFPPPFAMWNDRYRDCVRRFWRGDERILPELAGRLLGSADFYEASGRRPWVSINLVTSHDGFTLADLVSYGGRHNEANGEHNRDGHHDNLGANHGVEGPTADPYIRELRARQRLNLLATLLFSQGTPMLLMGDELGRTQQGNNNVYCQDNELSWVDWPGATADDRAFADLVARLVELRRTHPLLRQTRYLHGEPTADGVPNVTWLAPEGRVMTHADWHEPRRRCFGVQLGGQGWLLLVLLNADHQRHRFVLPRRQAGVAWHIHVDTADLQSIGVTEDAVPLAARSLVLLAAEETPAAAPGR